MKLSTPWRVVLVLVAMASSQTMAAAPTNLRGGGVEVASDEDHAPSPLIAPTIVGSGTPTPAPQVDISFQNQRMLGPSRQNKNKNKSDSNEDSIKINDQNDNNSGGTSTTKDIEINGWNDNNPNRNNHNNAMKYTDIPPPPLPQQGHYLNPNQRKNNYPIVYRGQPGIPPPPPRNGGGNNQRLRIPQGQSGGGYPNPNRQRQYKNRLRRKKNKDQQQQQQQQQNTPPNKGHHNKKKKKKKQEKKDNNGFDIDLRPKYVKNTELDKDYRKHKLELEEYRKNNPPPTNPYASSTNRDQDNMKNVGKNGWRTRNDLFILENSRPKKNSRQEEKLEWERKKKEAVDAATRLGTDYLKLVTPQVAIAIHKSMKIYLDDAVTLANGDENPNANVYVELEPQGKTMKEKANDHLPSNLQFNINKVKEETPADIRYEDRGTIDKGSYKNAEDEPLPDNINVP